MELGKGIYDSMQTLFVLLGIKEVQSELPSDVRLGRHRTSTPVPTAVLSSLNDGNKDTMHKIESVFTFQRSNSLTDI